VRWVLVLNVLVGGLAACGGRATSVYVNDCLAGDARSCVGSAQPHIFDAIAQRDRSAEAKMRRYLMRACELGHVGACTFVARLYYFWGADALGEPQRRAVRRRAEAHIERLIGPACKRGKRSACRHLARFFALTDRPGVAAYYQNGAHGNRPVARPHRKEVSSVDRRARRIRGDVRVAPSERIKYEMYRVKKRRLVVLVSMCLDARGEIERLRIVVPTGVPSYERAVLQKMKAWRYRPALSDGRPVPLCTLITFVYRQTNA
jgi:TonB family protein